MNGAGRSVRATGPAGTGRMPGARGRSGRPAVRVSGAPLKDVQKVLIRRGWLYFVVSRVMPDTPVVCRGTRGPIWP
jgi:hypothetical protein